MVALATGPRRASAPTSSRACPPPRRAGCRRTQVAAKAFGACNCMSRQCGGCPRCARAEPQSVRGGPKSLIKVLGPSKLAKRIVEMLKTKKLRSKL